MQGPIGGGLSVDPLVVLQLALKARPRHATPEVLAHEPVSVEVFVGGSVFTDPDEEAAEIFGHAPSFEQPERFDQSPIFASESWHYSGSIP